jgi:tRNA nucleotidyltransferase (CCA-adding enzyme)
MKIYLVGGAVRDRLLGYPYHEKDWVVVGATAEQLLAEGFQPVGKDFPVFLHPQSKEEYALARTERKTAAGYTGFDCYASPDVTLEEDLQRRDLTINAIAEDSDGKLFDPYGGQQDIENKLLRHVSAAFTEDPLRILRVARFSARYAHLGFTVAKETLQLMQALSAGDELQALPAERIWKELQRALGERSPQQFFITLQQAHALQQLMPELSPLQAHSLQVLERAAGQQQPASVGFAVLLYGLDKDSCLQLCAHLKSPNEFKDLAVLVSRFGRQCQQAFSAADALLDTLEQLDPFRRPERFELFLHCCDLLFDQPHSCQQLRQALALCATISAKQLAAEGLAGKAIARALRSRRLQAINEQLFNQDIEAL